MSKKCVFCDSNTESGVKGTPICESCVSNIKKL